MTFVPSALLALFALVFGGIWSTCRMSMFDRKGDFLLFYAASFLVFGMALLSQIAHLPPDAGLNAVISGSLYIAGCLLLVKGILARSGESLSVSFYASAFLAILIPLSYFQYVDNNLVVRIYLLNFGMGAIFLALAVRARFLRHGTVPDRILFWLVIALALHFFLRTLLTVGSVENLPHVDPLDSFAASSFWVWSKVSVAVLGAVVGLGLLTVSGADIIIALRGERDTDPLTGTLNRRGLDTYISRLLAKGSQTAVSVIVCDLDYFKSINDTYGHAVGDAVLVDCARILMKSVRSTDLVARIGGEEFVVVLPGMTVENAYVFAERIRKAIQNRHFDQMDPNQIVTCSLGVTKFRKNEDLWTAAKRADEILYAAKKAGRNRTYAEGIAA
ncbi:GGDEF domain-containing protein [Phyllobacterium salinisoli]|uniref:diguanylate cyclase n=1 Tax=Phyllobacterium salinisoli TaxID=1899321 RepID=A0A368K8Z8_9HYPH|nr:GGDEF domain-containing protein [Phyllobacterium salinisoli]RCS24953.1 GGDEF domain-containing protein [Phyllobacterium salinisoli]